MGGRGQRIRVLRVIARMNVGGPALQVSALMRGLDPKRFDQRLLTGSIDDGEKDYRELRATDIEAQLVLGLGRPVRPSDDVRALVSVHRAIREFRPHIVHTHAAKAGMLARISAWTAGVPVTVHTFHGHLLRGYFSPAVTQAVARTERTLARRTTRLVAVGARVRDELLAAGIGRPEQYTVVPPGVDLEPSCDRHAAREELGLPSETKVIAFIGRLTAVKRLDRLIDAVAAATASRTDTTLVIAGEGDLLESVRHRAEILGDRVRFLGWRSDVQVVLAAADLVLLTSDNEGMPVSLIEAAAAGRPAVTTDVGSAREVVEHGVTGFLTSMETRSIADAVSALLDDESLRERMGSAAARRARAMFRSHRLVSDTEQLYEELAVERGFA